MASQKVVPDTEKRNTPEPSNAPGSERRKYIYDIPKRNCNEERNDKFHMMFSTTYGFNISHTKRIHVGLQTTNKGIFVPMVKLTGNYAEGIYFTDSWQQFLNNMGLIDEYLNANNKSRPDPINVAINFTSSYGSRSILLAYKENEEATMENIEIQHRGTTTDSQPPTKRRKTYAIAIVMQKSTFRGLKNIVKCVDAHLKHLQSVTDNVNKCTQYLIKEIELNLPKNYIDSDIVKLRLKGNYHEIARNARTQINDLTFLDMYFDIIFVELTSLRFNEILRIIFSNRNL
ncbi:hypothetical protein P5V15_013848 [Pogonomyrmex californicus]